MLCFYNNFKNLVKSHFFKTKVQNKSSHEIFSFYFKTRLHFLYNFRSMFDFWIFTWILSRQTCAALAAIVYFHFFCTICCIVLVQLWHRYQNPVAWIVAQPRQELPCFLGDHKCLYDQESVSILFVGFYRHFCYDVVFPSYNGKSPEHFVWTLENASVHHGMEFQCWRHLHFDFARNFVKTTMPTKFLQLTGNLRSSWDDSLRPKWTSKSESCWWPRFHELFHICLFTFLKKGSEKWPQLGQ